MMAGLAANTACPWSGDPVSPDSLTQYRGQKVGFCNPGCRDKFEAATAHFDASIGFPNRDPSLAMFDRSARYNAWFNRTLFDAVARLDPAECRRDAGAFFGSIETSLNHIMVWDIVWLQRIAQALSDPPSLASVSALPTPTANDEIIHATLGELSEERRRIDTAIVSFTGELTAQHLPHRIGYRRQSGAAFEHSLAEVLQHMFNHQTHHRGQVTTLLSQAGIDPGVTDMVAMIIDEETEEARRD